MEGIISKKFINEKMKIEFVEEIGFCRGNIKIIIYISF